MSLATAGESHGKAVIAVLSGLPAGLTLNRDFINKELARRQGGFGRGGRMEIETDEVQILSGHHQGETIGSPLAMLIENEDWENWKEVMSPNPPATSMRPVHVPRPGHADLPGAQKYGFRNCRKVLERSSARETAARVAGGAVCKLLMKKLGITISSRVSAIGGIKDETEVSEYSDLNAMTDESPVRVLDSDTEVEIIDSIERTRTRGDTLGGTFEVFCSGVPPGLGSYVQWDSKLDSILAGRVMSIPAIKSVEIGLGREAGEKPGSEVHDEIFSDSSSGFYRKSNNAGGLEGGITNGEPIEIRATMKPIPTLGKPLHSVDLETGEEAQASKERSDVCAVPAASIVAESEVALAVTDTMREDLGGAHLDDMLHAVKRQRKKAREIHGQ
ncbi:MAG: chorismate synthase [Candidatus Acetothermia bacterium]